MGSTISWHIEKHKMNEVGGLRIHNQRLTNNHKNKKIDTSESSKNLYNVAVREKFGKDTSYEKRIEYVLEKSTTYNPTKKRRKDAVVDVEHTIQFGGDVLEKLDQKDLLMVQAEAANFIYDLVDFNNVIDSNYHVDETNPHFHIDTVPLTKDGKLSAKTLYSKVNLRKIQQDLLEHMQKMFPELGFERLNERERGFKNGQVQADYERLQELKDENEAILEQVKKTKYEIKSEIIDELTDLEKEYQIEKSYVGPKLYQRKLDKVMATKDVKKLTEFKEKYGLNPRSLMTEQGRNQHFWGSIKSLRERLNKAKKEVEVIVKRKYQDLENGFKNIMAELVINLAPDKYTRNQTRALKDDLIKHGGLLEKNEVGDEVLVELEKLVPQMLEQATEERLEQFKEFNIPTVHQIKQEPEDWENAFDVDDYDMPDEYHHNGPHL